MQETGLMLQNGFNNLPNPRPFPRCHIAQRHFSFSFFCIAVNKQSAPFKMYFMQVFDLDIWTIAIRFLSVADTGRLASTCKSCRAAFSDSYIDYSVGFKYITESVTHARPPRFNFKEHVCCRDEIGRIELFRRHGGRNRLASCEYDTLLGLV